MKKLLIPFLTAGYPEKNWFEPLVRAMDAAGADYIEIGVPFSDPIADGPTIQKASQAALDQGVHADWILQEVSRFRKDIRAELIFFSYFNPLNALGGLETAAKRLKDAGFYGVLVPDLALEQAQPLANALGQHGLHYIPLIAPTTTTARLKAIAPYTTSFAYGVSVTGVTGARVGVAQGLDEYLERVRTTLEKPFVVGFGIATPEDARQIGSQADGIVVGSALIKSLEGSRNAEEAVSKLTTFLKPIRKAIDTL